MAKPKKKKQSRDAAPKAVTGEVVDQSATDGSDEETQQGLQLLEQGNVELSLVGGVTTAQLRERLTVQTEQRALIKAFIHHHLVEGIDYGQIHVVRECPDEKRARGSCTKNYHMSKRVLFKPGQEKIFSLFSITDTLEKDTEAYEMLGNTPGLVAYKCTLYQSGKDKSVGHGRGAATVGEQGRNANSTIKIAEKRARMDACLSLGFSEYFAQDLDDPDYKAQAQQANERAAAEAAARDKDDLGLWKRDPGEPVDDNERKMLFALVQRAGYTEPAAMLELLAANGIVDRRVMKSGEARGLMRKLRDGTYTPVAVIPADTTPSTAATDNTAESEPDLVIDEDFKSNVIDLYKQIGLSSWGERWFFKKVCGRPFVSFDKLEDKYWQAAYDLVQDVLEGRVELSAGCLADGTDDQHTDADNVQQVFGGGDVVDFSQPSNKQE
jgi:hypothetical protein